MDVNSQNVSLSLYSYLCNVVGSEDVVKMRREMYNVLDNICRTDKLKYVCSGSRSEGLDLSGSDYDELGVVNPYPVYENIEDLSNHKDKRHTLVPLIMDTNDTKPGYALLKLCDRTDIFHNPWCVYIGNEIFVSSALFRGSYWVKDTLQHGPCCSDGLSDIAFGFHCKKWISQAEEWIYRSRSSWPHNRLIEKIVQRGILFVPVGCKNSPREYLEFRISFNVAEKILVHSFSHVQLLCYALLKLILNHFIKPQYEDLLCSYFLKTIMFWVSEGSAESTWKPHNLIQWFDQCLKRLVYCVTYSICLHYFIPDLNFFEDRFSKSEHDSLTTTLQCLYKSGWKCLLYTPLFSSFNFGFPASSAGIVPSVSALPCVHSTSMSVRDYTSDITLYRAVIGSLSLPGKQMYYFMLSQQFQWAAQRIPTLFTSEEITVSQTIPMALHCIQVNTTFQVTNKQRYHNYRRCLNYLLNGIHHDAVSGWLLLASFFYTCKHYHQCLQVLRYCLPKCTPDKIMMAAFIDHKLQHDFNIEMQQHVKNGFQRTCKRRVLDCVIFEKMSCIIPAELASLVANMVEAFPPVVFAHFLRCVCLHRLNRIRDKLKALRDLETTVGNMYFIRNNDIQKEVASKCIDVAKKMLGT